MDEGKVLLVNLAKGRLGEDSSATLGSLLVSTTGLAAQSRAELPADARRPFFLYVDEFQSFTTLAFANMAAELRKAGLGLVLAHQHFHQLEPDVKHAVLGNAGTLIAFRLGPEDAPLIAAEFAPAFDSLDLLNLPNRRFYLRLMIDGAPSQPFSAETLDLAEIGRPLSPVDLGRLTILSPDELPDFFATLALQQEPAETVVKGYRVKVSRTDISPEEAKARREVLAKLVAKSLGRED